MRLGSVGEHSQRSLPALHGNRAAFFERLVGNQLVDESDSQEQDQ